MDATSTRASASARPEVSRWSAAGGPWCAYTYRNWTPRGPRGRCFRPKKEEHAMPTVEEYAKQSREQRMQRLGRTADELSAAMRGHGDAVLSRRPDAKNWAAKEVVCHLRDTEET